jgi:hypothetical protein
MRFWMLISMLASLLPLVALGAWIWPVLVARWHSLRWGARLGLGGLWLVCAGFLLGNPHDDSFTGLDNMAYRHLTHAFLEGRGFHDRDAVLAEVPGTLRENFLFHRGPRERPTRDCAFQLSSRQSAETQPFFMPGLSLAAAGVDPVLAPERLVPLAGALWLALMLAAGFCAGGGWGVVAAGALLLGTAWPAWFLRGFYPEGVGAMLISGVIASASIRPLRGAMAAVAGFALGLAVTCHPTLVVLAVPIAWVLMLEQRDAQIWFCVAAGMLAGWLPLWAVTRWVCQPYGDWTHWETLRKMLFSIPQHQAVALALGALAVVSVGTLWAGFHPVMRARIRRVDAWALPWGWGAACALPLAGIALLPGAVGETLRTAWTSAWSGIRWPYALAWLAGAGLAWRRQRPVRERVGLAAVCWAMLFFLFIQGMETPVGLWSQRRFLPVVLTGIAVLVAPLSAGLAACAARRRWAGWAAAAGMMLAGLWNPWHWPAAYLAVNERGAAEWIQAVSDRIGTNRWVVFDYYPHSVPYAAGLKQKVLGLGETSWTHWPEVAGWLAALARREEVWVATSWSPCTLEEGAKLETMFAATGRFPGVHAKAFFPAVRSQRTVQNTFSRWVPLAGNERGSQDKVMDGSPVGLRGPWGEVRKGATWSRQGSGIIGPVPEKGGQVFFEADCKWVPPTKDWPAQILRVTPPWGGEPLRLEVPAGEQVVRGILARPAGDGERQATGVYLFHAVRPYNPAEYGLRHYSADLGVILRRIIIRIELEGSSVTS